MTKQLPLKQFNQTRGPSIRFRGECIAQSDFETQRGELITMEIWETEGGALVAVTTGALRDDDEDIRATVVERKVKGVVGGVELLDYDDQAMRFAVMEHFQWSDRARSMVKKLKWKLVRDVA